MEERTVAAMKLLRAWKGSLTALRGFDQGFGFVLQCLRKVFKLLSLEAAVCVEAKLTPRRQSKTLQSVSSKAKAKEQREAEKQ